MTVPATRKQKAASIRALLTKQHKQLEDAFPIRLDPERFARIVVTSCMRTPKLLDCTPESLLGAVMVSAQLGLEPDGVRNMAHLVPYGDKVTFIPGYMGLADLSLRSGKIKKIVPRIVYQGDEFAYQYGTNEFINHVPGKAKDRGKAIAAYAIAWFKEGDYQFEVMEIEDIENIRKRSAASSSGPWVTDWNAMAKKTVLRQLCKYLPSNSVAPELAIAVGLDEAGERGEVQIFPDHIDLDTGEILDDEKSDLDKLADQHGAPPAKEPEKKAAPGAEPSPQPAKEEPPPVASPITAEERQFIQSFKPLRQPGTEKFWLQHHKYLISLPEDHVVRVEFWKKYTNVMGMEPQLPSEASHTPTGPMAEAPADPGPAEEKPSVTEEVDLFEDFPKKDQDLLASAEETETLNKIVVKSGYDLLEFHQYAAELNSYEFDRYTKLFLGMVLKDSAKAFESFLKWKQIVTTPDE